MLTAEFNQSAKSCGKYEAAIAISDFVLGSSAQQSSVMLGLGNKAGIQQADAKWLAYNREIEERAGKGKKDDTATLLAMLDNSASIGDIIAAGIVDGMSEAEIDDAITFIEKTTGQEFFEFARERLGENMPERNPGESDNDYERRVFQAITADLFDDSGKIKPEYEDDPVTLYLLNDQKSSELINKAQQMVGKGASKEELSEFVKEEYSMSKAAEKVLGNTDDARIVQAGKNDHADESYRKDFAVTDNASFFGGASTNSSAEGNSMEVASYQGRIEFNKQSVGDATTENVSENDHDNTEPDTNVTITSKLDWLA